jgi:capsular exopolysaccharide synthesis family protein
MTPNQTPGRPTPPPSRAGPPGPAGAAPAIDPVKLLLKYKWVLGGAALAGAIIGLVSHLVLIRVYPIYTAEAIFECLAAEMKPDVIFSTSLDQNEIEMFMGTQVAFMKGDTVLNKVIRDPRLPREAPNWSEPFMKTGGVDTFKGMEELRDIVKASSLANTYYIRLAASTNHKNDAAGIVRLVRENYLEERRRTMTADINAKKKSVRDSIVASERQLEELNARRTRLVRDQRLDTLDGQRSQASESLRSTSFELLQVEQQLESARVGLERDEAQLRRGVGIQYDNALRQQVDFSQQIGALQHTLNSLESSKASMQNSGIRPGHRNFQVLQAEIDAIRAQIEQTRERLLREAFEARIDQYRLFIQQLEAQQADLLTKSEELGEELIELTRIVGEVQDIDRQIQTTVDMIATQQMSLADLDAAASLESVTRVRVIQPETVPDLPSFPKLYIMIPLGVILLTGAVTGTILVVEILDQRVKGPADLAGLGRMTVLGLVPDAAEDPSSPEHPESAFRDVPGSVTAEHYRQLRTRVSKAMQRGGHRTLLVVGATPGSGATSVVSNLGSALVAAGHSVLLVDANYRRPALHTAFDAPESPGMADILAGQSSLDAAVIKSTGAAGPDLLPAGTPRHRMVEQLGTRGVEDLFNAARARYDFVLVDVAPALVSGDAQTLANRCDASMLVARALHEKKGMVARLRNELAESRAEFLGGMVNAVRSAAGGYMRKNIRTQAAYAGDPKTA